MSKSFIVLVIFILSAVFAFAAITGNAPQTTINSVNYTDYIGNIIPMPFSKGDEITVNATVVDIDHFNDIKKVQISFDNYTVPCSRVSVIDENTSEHKCILTITPKFYGQKEVYINTTDSYGLSNHTKVGTYFFNPKNTLNNYSINFTGPFASGSTYYSDITVVNVTSDSNNTFDVSLWGNDVKPQRNCSLVTYCSRYGKTCSQPCYIYYSNGTCRRTRSVCVDNTSNCTQNRTKTVCNTTAARCGTSNKIDLDNFKYSFDNTTWNDIDYHPAVIVTNNSNYTFNLTFKVSIPLGCSGNFVINGSNLQLKVEN